MRPVCTTSNIKLIACLASVTDPAAVADIIKEHAIDVILHAAAYKHVPLVECNAVEGARNNVLGSSGSVVPLFRQQIEAGGPVTVTHEEVTRYFMTTPEAARLVLLAGAFSKGRDLFVLNMGEPVKIIDLARRMIEMYGRTVRDGKNPNGDMEIKIIGMRPGEKLYEELLLDDTSLSDTLHEKILRANFEGFSQIEVARMVWKVEEGVERREPEAIFSVIDQYVKEANTAQ